MDKSDPFPPAWGEQQLTSLSKSINLPRHEGESLDAFRGRLAEAWARLDPKPAIWGLTTTLGAFTWG